jgi:protein transport protein SEC61 subunit alpha
MSTTRFLDLLKPLKYLSIKVKNPPKKIKYENRVKYTIIVLMVFLLFQQVPLFGLDKQLKQDQMNWMRQMMASHKGTLMELGISPIITTQMVIQLVTGAKLIEVNRNLREDRAVEKAATKFFSLLLTFGQAFVYVWSGNYGPWQELGLFKASAIILQLFIAGVLIILLDEMLNKGYGITQGGISLFIAVGIAENVMWRSFSPITMNTGRGAEFEGAVVNMVHLLLTRSNTWSALKEGFLRSNLPNMLQVIATLVVFLVAVYLHKFDVSLPLHTTKMRGMERPYKIKLFGSNMPVILQAALVQNVHFISQLLYSRFEGNPLIRLFGRWAIDERTGQYLPQGGFAYYLHAPDSLSDVAEDPLHAILHVIFVVGSCAMFAMTYVEISGNSPREVAQNLKDSGLTIGGYPNESNYAVLDRYMKTAAALGGGVIGLLTIVADLMGALGSGTGILLAVQIVSNIYEELSQRYPQDMKFLD